MKNELKKEKIILEVIADIYIFVLVLLFPFIVDKTGFFHIMEIKWYSYVVIASTYLGINLLVLLYFYIFKKINYFKNYKFTKIQLLLLVFLLVNTCSCFLSPYFSKANLFIGVGRGEGLILVSLYTLSFLCISIFSKFKRKYILYFSISSILLSFIATLQYIGFNPFNMYQDGIGTHNVSFMSTIGNIDFLSAIYCLLLPISFAAYIFLEDNNKLEKVLHILSIYLGAFIIGIIDVQSGKVALLGTFVIVFPFILQTNKRLSKLLIVISAILMAYCTNIIINPKYYYSLGKIVFNYQFTKFAALFIVISIILIILAKTLKNIQYDITSNKKIIKCYYLLLIACGVVGLIGLYIINFKSGILYEVHELLHGNFDDNFGTYRVFLWKRTINLVGEYPLLGSGPDTFAVRFMAKYTADIAKLGPVTINDTAANVYLTMLINIGIVGAINYLLFIYYQIKDGIKKISSYSSILLIAIICYLIQDCFNLSIVIVTPIFWLMMGLHFSIIKNKK